LAYNNYANILLDPKSAPLAALPDPFTMIPTTVERVSTVFTLIPNGTAESRPGEMAMVVSPFMTNTVEIIQGAADVKGVLYGPNQAAQSFDVYKYSSFESTATRFRTVAMQVEAKYIGTDFQNSGIGSVALYPPNSALIGLVVDYDSIADFSESRDVAVENGMHAVFFPAGIDRATRWYVPSADGLMTLSEGLIRSKVVYGSKGAYNDTATAALGKAMLQVRVTHVYETVSVDPLLTGGQRTFHKHIGASRDVEEAGALVAHVRHSKTHLGNYGHDIWDAIKMLGPVVAPYVGRVGKYAVSAGKKYAIQAASDAIRAGMAVAPEAETALELAPLALAL
jgi:hypothetical protein